MDAVERRYHRGSHVGYHIHSDYCYKENDGMSIRMSTTIEIVDDYLAGRCHLCREKLPPGNDRQICLNCLGEQSGLAVQEVSMRGDLIDFLLWRQRRSTGDGEMMFSTLVEAAPTSLEQSISDLEQAVIDMRKDIKDGAIKFYATHETPSVTLDVESRTAADLSAGDWKELEEAQSGSHDGVAQVSTEESPPPASSFARVITTGHRKALARDERLPPGYRGRADDYFSVPSVSDRLPTAEECAEMAEAHGLVPPDSEQEVSGDGT